MLLNKNSCNIPKLFFLVSFIILILALMGVEYYCYKQSKTLYTYYFSHEQLDSTNDDILLTVTVSKQWDDSDITQDKPIGAQYDGKIFNKSNKTFKNWSVNLIYSESLIIDSSWNGSFISNDNIVVFVAKGETGVVHANSLATFGSVMYSDKLMFLKGYELSGYKEVVLTDLLFFWVLLSLFFIWFIVLIIHTVLYYKTLAYQKRFELDSQIILQSMNTLVSFIDAKDPYTKNHSTRVAIYSSEIARLLKMSKDEMEKLYYTALMHDCGKIGIPDVLLKKAGTLNDEEYSTVQSHVEIGNKLLGEFTAIPNIHDGAHYHHERFDGKGYPEGLKGLEIPLCARIICVTDAYDAMSSTRCYRSALSKEEIMAEMITNSGEQFDSEIVLIMISLIESHFVDKVIEEYPIT